MTSLTKIHIDDELSIDARAEDAFINNEPVGLTPLEFSVLHQLALNVGRALSRTELAESALDGSTDTRAVDSHLKNIRKKLHENARAPKWIKTVRGVGYRLDAPEALNDQPTSKATNVRRYTSANNASTLTIDFDGRRALIDSEEIGLTSSELETLLALSSQPGDTITSEDLSMKTIGAGFLESGRLLATHIKNLRAKMGDHARKPHWIETRHGVGFCFIGIPIQEGTPAEGEGIAEDLQRALSEFLDVCAKSIVVWSDAGGFWQSELARLTLPEDTIILDEDETPRFALLEKASELGPDERLVIYRKKRAGIDSADWFADIESYAEHFSFSKPTDLAHGDAVSTDNGNSSPFGITSIGRLKLEQDWYTPEAFQSALTELNISLSLQSLSASEHGYRLVDDCVLSRAWSAPAAYYRSLLQGLIVLHESIPQDIRSAGSFKRFCAQEISLGRLFDYDEEAWITPKGLRELDIDASDLDAFAREASQYWSQQAIPQFTLPLLRSSALNLPLLNYDLSDCFYESALASRREYVTRGRLGERSIFSPTGTSARGRDLVSSIVREEGSLFMDDLADILREDYGILVTVTQVSQLVHAASLFYSPDLDRVYADHNQFVREVE